MHIDAGSPGDREARYHVTDRLPIVDPNSYDAVCAVVDGCLTCGDVAVAVTVVEANEPDAMCEDSHGNRGSVGVELVAPVTAGETLLIHGGVAIARLAGRDKDARSLRRGAFPTSDEI